VSLVDLLQEEATRRDVWPSVDGLSPALAFMLVRDLPYQRSTSRQPEALLREWRGTGPGKHYLLRGLLEEMGLGVRVVLATHHFTEEYSEALPPPLSALLEQGPIPDVHTFLRVEGAPGSWSDVDVTWPLLARRLGLPANGAFRPGRDMRLACTPLDVYEVPENADPEAAAERLLEAHCGPDRPRHDRFMVGLDRWVWSTLYTGLDVL